MKRPKVSTKISQDSWLFERQGVVSLPSWRNDSPWSWQWSWRTWDSGCPSPVILMMVAKSCTTLDGWNPINHGLNHLSTGGSDFSTVSWGFLSIRDWAFVVWVYCGDPMDEQQRGHEFLLTFFLWIYWGWKKMECMIYIDLSECSINSSQSTWRIFFWGNILKMYPSTIGI